MSAVYLYAGSYTKNEKDPQNSGIGIYRYHPDTGEAEYLDTVHREIIAGTLFVNSARSVLYVADERKENPDLGNRGGGRVFAFAIDPQTGNLTELNRKSSFGTLPAYIIFDDSGEHVLTCNHSNANWTTEVEKDADGVFHLRLRHSDCTVVMYPVSGNGALGDPCDIVIFPQEKGVIPCLHSIACSPDGKYFAVCDRNMNKVYFLTQNASNDSLMLLDTLDFSPESVHTPDHSPRYGAFHPVLPRFYFNSERIPYLTTVSYSADGKFAIKDVQHFSPDLPGIDGLKYTQSDLCIHPDGNTLYILHRIINAVSVFHITEDGIPQHMQTLRLSGEGPRGCRIAPDGRFLLVANPGSKEITTLRINPGGTLIEVSRAFGQETPCSLAFFEV